MLSNNSSYGELARDSTATDFELSHAPTSPKHREIARDSNAKLEYSNAAPFSRTYSEGISIVQEGPVRSFTYSSFLEYGETPKNYKERVRLILRMVPHEYCSTLVVDDRSDDPQPLRYFQEIRFKPKWVVRNFEETVYNYPKEVLKRYLSTLTYDCDSRPRTFVSGLTVCVPVNSVDLGQLLTPPPSPEAFEVFQNGTKDAQEPLRSPVWYGSSKVKLGFDENSNFCATKDMAVNGV